MKFTQDSAILTEPELLNLGSMDLDKSFGSTKVVEIAIDNAVNSIIKQGNDDFNSEHNLTDISFNVGMQNNSNLSEVKETGYNLKDKFNLSQVRNAGYGFKDTHKYSLKTQRWKGHILEIGETSFTARLDDISNPGKTYEISEFELSEVSEEDRELLCVGAIFYLSLGQIKINGQLKREYILRFKRITNWSSEEFDKAADRASRLAKNLTWD